MSARDTVTRFLEQLQSAGYLLAKKIPSRRGPVLTEADATEIERQLTAFLGTEGAAAPHAAAPEPERFVVTRNGRFLTARGGWTETWSEAKTWVRRQLAHDRARIENGQVIPLSQARGGAGYEITCPGCGERIYDETGDLLNCPVCDTDLSWP